MDSIKFKQLFSFKQKEINTTFKYAKKKDSIAGFNLLTASLKKIASDNDTITFPHGKLLIVIPRKVGKAHERNLIKRRIKSIYYEEKLYKKQIISIIFAREEATKVSFEELKNFLTKNLK